MLESEVLAKAMLDNMEVKEDEMETKSREEREQKVKELFPNLKVKITNLGEEQSFVRTAWNSKYRVTLTNEGRTTWFLFHDSVYNYDKGVEPTLSDVLYAITGDAQAFECSRDVEDFMHEFGYEDWATANKVRKACEKAYDNLSRVLGSCEGYRALNACYVGY